MLFLSESDVRSAITMAEAIEKIEKALSYHAQRVTKTPLRTHLELEEVDGIGLFMPSWIEPDRIMGIKSLSVYRNNPTKGRPAIQGTLQLFDGETGNPTAIMEASYLTKLRTGASSGVATKYLAPQNPKKLALIGTGAQAFCQLSAVLTAAPSIDTVFLYDLHREQAQRFMEEATQSFPDVDFQVSDTIPNAIQGAQVITTCTTTQTPLFSKEELSTPVHINAVGAFKPDMQEIATEVIAGADLLVVDNFEGAMHESGDLRIPLSEGKLKHDSIHGEIGEIIMGDKRQREDGDAITVYESVGMGSLDVVIAQAIFEGAKSRGIGKELSL